MADNATARLNALRSRAKNGDVSAQAELGYRYATGKGVRRNFRLAAAWDKSAAKSGNAISMYNLAQSYLEGRGVRKNVVTALQLYKQVWNNRNIDAETRSDAAVNIGWATRATRIGSSPLEEARKWFKRAARLGNSSALYNLGELIESQGDCDLAAHYYYLASALHHTKAMYALARLHIDNRIKEVDYDYALELLSAAAPAIPSAKRLLHSERLRRLRETPRRKSAFTSSPDPRLGGVWDRCETEVSFEVLIHHDGTNIRVWDPEEEFEISGVTWFPEGTPPCDALQIHKLARPLAFATF